MKESRARRDRARVYVEEGWWTSGPWIEEEWGIEATRLHPSDDGPDRRVRHTRLKPTDNLPNALSSLEGTHAYHLDDSLLIRFRTIFHKSLFYCTFIIIPKFLR